MIFRLLFLGERAKKYLKCNIWIFSKDDDVILDGIVSASLLFQI